MSIYESLEYLYVCTYRISGTDWVEESLPDEPSWRSEDTARFAPLLYEHGVDLIDVSSGGNSKHQKIGGPVLADTGERMQAYQAPLARDVMRGLGAKEAYPSSKNIEPGYGSSQGRPRRMLVATVGKITSGTQAEELLDGGYADVVVVGRQFLKDPGTVWTFAEELGDIKVRLASQIGWGFVGRGKKTSEIKEAEKK